MVGTNLRFKELHIQNFRPYEDVKIEFSQDPKKTITIFEGTNSAGKTSIMNAIHWCIYGKEQFLNEGEGKPIPNQRALNRTKVGQTTETSVKLVISDDKGPKYQIERMLHATRNNDSKEKKNDNDAGGQIDSGFTTTISIRFSERNPDESWDTTDNESRFEAKVNKFLPKKISEFVIFNGEILDTFFRSENAENIRTGIERVSGLPVTDRSIQHWNDMFRQYSKKAAHAAGASGSLLEEKLETKSKNLDSKKKQIAVLQRNLDELDEQQKQLEVEIEKHPLKAFELLQEQLEAEKRHQKEYEDIAFKLKNSRVDYIIDNFGRILLKDSIGYAYDILKESEIKGETPPPVMDFFLEDIIKRNECMCGTKLKGNQKAIDALISLKERVANSKIAQIANEGKETLVNMKELPTSQIIHEKLDLLRKDENRYSAAFREAKEKVNGTIEKLQEYDEKKIRQIATSLDKIRQKRSEVRDELNLNNSQILAIESEITDLKKDLKSATETTSASKQWNEKRNLAEKAYLTLNQVREELLSEIRERVQQRTEEIFKKLITRHWQVDRIEIDENYKIRVIDKEGVDNLKTLSAGQTLYLALSYIAALREVTDTNYPMIIDSPFGRIAGLERVRAAEDLPSYLPETQITFLVTNTEYKARVAQDSSSVKHIPSIKETLQKNKRIWKEFELVIDKITEESSRTLVKEITV